MKTSTAFWLKFSLINLFLVALLGTYLRLKIYTELPLTQKNLLNAHSHFAFLGWIGHTLMVLMIYVLKKKIPSLPDMKYSLLLAANLLCAYGMLFSFVYQGYGTISIVLLILSVLLFYVFAYVFYKDSRHLKSELFLKWFQGALFFGAFSAFGTFFLAYTLTSKNLNFDAYLSSIYFYLHFQYNGWFLFACIGLFLSMFKIDAPFLRRNNQWYYLLFTATLATFFLSILWLKISEIIYWVTTFCALLQLVVWIRMHYAFKLSYQSEIKDDPRFLRWILILVSGFVALKFFLQFLLVFPELATIVYGIRPIVIAFLHLVLLGIISLFMLYFIFGASQKILPINRYVRLALIFFVIAVLVNELFLVLQGFFGFRRMVFSNINEWLLFAVALLLVSSGLLCILVIRNKRVS